MTTTTEHSDSEPSPVNRRPAVCRLVRAGTRPWRRFRRRTHTPTDATGGQQVNRAARSAIPAEIRASVLSEHHAATLARARRVSEELVRAGCNTGTVPYGYRARRIRVAPQGGRPRWRVRLVMEPVEAATVKTIFAWRGHDGLTVAEIHRRLLAARYPAPLDLATGQPGMWTRAVIRSILRNAKYLGRQVWGRHHHGRRAPRAAWVWSPEWAHPPIVSPQEFRAANRRSSTRTDTQTSADRSRGSARGKVIP